LEQPPKPWSLDDAGELSFLVHSHVHDEPEGRRVATFLYQPDDSAGGATVNRLRQFAAGTVDQPPEGPRPAGVITGNYIIENELRQIVQRDTFKVTLASAVSVLLLLALFYRRWRPFVAVAAPLMLAWIGFGAALAVLGIPLNLFNLLS